MHDKFCIDLCIEFCIFSQYLFCLFFQPQNHMLAQIVLILVPVHLVSNSLHLLPFVRVKIHSKILATNENVSISTKKWLTGP